MVPLTSFLLMLAFFLLSFASRPVYKAVYFLLFTVAVLLQYNYQSIASRFMTRTDLLAGLTSPLEYWIDAATLFFEWVGLLPIMLYLVLLLAMAGWRAYGGRALLALTTAALVVNALIYLVGFASSPAISVIAFWRTITVTALDRSTVIIYERESIAYEAGSRPGNNVVFIIDESVRGDHLSLNGYHRTTTPYLEVMAEHGLTANWGTAASAATCSIQSNQAMMMGLSTFPSSRRARPVSKSSRLL